MSPTRDSKASSLIPSSIFTKPSTCMSGPVIVPVLSTQSTSTRARASIHFMFWTRTSFFASLKAETTMAMLAVMYRPSGIIPRIAATIEVTLLLKVPSSMYHSWNTSVSPIGIIRTPMTFTSLSSDFIISDSSCLSLVASFVSFDIYELAPTAVRTAIHSPETT